MKVKYLPRYGWLSLKAETIISVWYGQRPNHIVLTNYQIENFSTAQPALLDAKAAVQLGQTVYYRN